MEKMEQAKDRLIVFYHKVYRRPVLDYQADALPGVEHFVLNVWQKLT